MNPSGNSFDTRLARLKADLIEQGRRVQALNEAAFDAAFAGDDAAARRVVEQDEVIDRVDIDLEKASVALLADATGGSESLAPEQLRMVLTIVKVNNELERIADVGVLVAEEVEKLHACRSQLPETFRVMANSVIGILRDCVACLDRLDAQLAKSVLASEDTVEAFKTALLRDAQEKVASGGLSVDQAFVFQEIATLCEIMADHCTNIAEQVLYVATGTIYRHMGGHWEQFNLPPKAGQ